MTNLHAEFELVHFSNADHFDLDIGMEVTAVYRISHKCNQLLLESIDILERGIPGCKDGDLFPHSLTTSDVLDPEVVEDNVGSLKHLAVVDTFEHGVEKRNVLDRELVGANIHAVSDVVWVLHEQEDAGT